MLAILVLAALAVVAAALDPAPPPVAGRARVSDGDSFRLGDERVRLLGLDAPELAQSCTRSDGSVWPCGRAARDRLARLLAKGHVDCRPEDRDRYDRLLAKCSVADADLGQTLVAEGLAISAGDYWDEQQRARAARIGIWSGDFDSPRAWRDDHPRPAGLLDWLPGF